MSPVTSKKTSLDFNVDGIGNLFRERYRRLIVSFLLLIASIFPGELGEVTRFAVFDAYTQVSVFVAATLLFFFGLEHFFKVGQKPSFVCGVAVNAEANVIVDSA